MVLAIGLCGPAAALTGDCVFRDLTGLETAGSCAVEGPVGEGLTVTLLIAEEPVASVTFVDGAGFMWANILRIDGEILSFDPDAGETNCWAAETSPLLLCVDGLGIH